MTRRAAAWLALTAALALAPGALAHAPDGLAGPPAQHGPGAPDVAGPDGYQLRFKCGDLPPGEDAAQQLLCPLSLFDAEDIMGSPRLAMHPKDADTVAFNALHGGPGLDTLFGEPPAAYGRNNAVHQPHTTWRTVNPYGVLDGGQLDWKDQPYYSHYAQVNTTEGGILPCPPICPSRLTTTQRVYGMDGALAIDEKARMYEASLYAMRNGNAGTWNYGLTVWKQDGPHKDRNQDVNYKNLKAERDANGMDTLDVAVPSKAHVVLLWRETAGDQAIPDPLGRSLKSWIQVAWSGTTTDALWTKMPKENVVGPCDAITNAVTWANTTIVGCVAGDGYEARPGAKRGDLDLWRVRVPDGTMEFVSTSPVRGEFPQLAVRADGKFAAASARVENPHRIRLEVSLSNFGQDWSPVQNYGPAFADRNKEIVKARVQALAFHARTGNLFLLYLEQYDTGATSPGAAAPLLFNKRLGTIHEYGEQPLAVVNLDLGNATTRKVFPVSVEGLDNEGVYEDLHDDFFLWKDKKTGDERVFVAYGDYGLVRFAELVQDNPGLIIGLPLQPPIVGNPVADPATSQQAAQVAAGVLGGVLAGAMALRMLLARAKRSAQAPALGGKP